MTKRTNGLLALSVVALLSGCQTAPPQAVQALDNHTFMSLWGTYQRCSSSTNLDQMRADVKTLSQATRLRTSHTDFTMPLPEALLRLVSAQPMRIAADPNAMLAACSIHTAEVAMEAGKNEVAAELLNRVLGSQEKAEYSYYVQQAKATLDRMHAVQATGKAVLISSSHGPQFLPAPQAKSMAQPPPPGPSDSQPYE